jgi:hypothetical protein
LREPATPGRAVTDEAASLGRLRESDLAASPVVLVDRAHTAGGIIMSAVGVAMMMPIGWAVRSIALDGPGYHAAACLLIAAGGAYMLWHGLRALFWRHVVVIDGRAVTSTIEAPFLREHWTEPLDGFQGVVLTRTRREGATYRTIALGHVEESRRVLLYDECVRGPWDADAEALHLAAARRFGLKALEETDGRLVEVPGTAREET